MISLPTLFLPKVVGGPDVVEAELCPKGAAAADAVAEQVLVRHAYVELPQKAKS